MMTTIDPRIVAYLNRLEEAAGVLRAERRAELVAEIRDHIATRLGEPGSVAAGVDPVDAALARLGEPEEIVAAAADEPGAVEAGPAPAPAERRRSGGLEAAALILLLVGGFLFLIGWVVGAVLLWMSPRWTVREKLLGTLVWPGGLASPVLVGGALTVLVARVDSCVTTQTSGGVPIEQCTGGGGPNWLAIALLVAAIAAPLFVVGLLAVRSSRRAALG